LRWSTHEAELWQRLEPPEEQLEACSGTKPVQINVPVPFRLLHPNTREPTIIAPDGRRLHIARSSDFAEFEDPDTGLIHIGKPTKYLIRVTVFLIIEFS
jgi:hypothetical protein